MTTRLSKPILYLITPGAGNSATTSSSPEFQKILSQVAAAVEARVQLVQLREKQLPTRLLFELTARVVELSRGTSTKILVNDRSDVAKGAGADGVHLTTQSIAPAIVKDTFGQGFLVAVSTHSLTEARAARDSGADFAVFGPVFSTASKKEYGAAVGVNQLEEVSRSLAPFPVLALGGIAIDNVETCFRAGASGVAGISLFERSDQLSEVVSSINELWRRGHHENA